MFLATGLAVIRRAGWIALLALTLAACASGPELTEGDAEHTAAPTATPAEPAPEPMPAETMPAEPAAPEPEFHPAAPERYVVREGDTLWSIANTFLRDPWHWPEIWLANPQIPNPHLIYPGDVLSIHHVDGELRVMVDGGPRVLPVERLSPRIRVEALDDVETLPISTLQPFMFRPRVVDEATLEQAPYIVAAHDERVIYGPGDRVYLRHAPDAERYDLYHVVRRDRALTDPDTGEELGIATLPIAEAEIVRGGEIATALLRTGDREAIRGDRLLPFDDEPDLLFDIGRPPADLEGTVILLFDAISQIGSLQAAVINRGKRDGVRNGQVFATWEAGRTARDPISRNRNELIELPEEEIGTMMVFRTFDKVAYALVLHSTHPIREGYKVRHP
ncbi:LysM peptidoglycan-binding domain-containing protein [Thioalkalivibrio paradoxus]|uniref:Peptidoglycan-binding protein n=1 Tax=Thioalkalivibrio paradoxus ARh 1 TaxID=713585 RepID=W0DLY3_9GAMM|nr:LysM peptidoglycan-binding domain-containing protein [Thioalkalivibrio paradoxus]AHE99466.1 peptidoglycan-binding protein [Thioalkalivibrio paradoxus ARh 1]